MKRIAWLIIVCSGLLGLQNGLGRVDFWLQDLAMHVHFRPSSDDIVLVTIDERSLHAIGRWPWPRALHAAALEKIAAQQPRAIGLDLVLSEPGDVQDDTLLAHVMAATPRLVLPISLELQASDAPPVLRPPLQKFGQTATAFGYINLIVSEDGHVRSLRRHTEVGTQRWPHFSQAVLEAGGKILNSTALDKDSPWRIPFAGGPGSFLRVSYIDLLKDKVAPDALRNKWVLVGVVAPGLGDAYLTPIGGDTTLMPGVEINANAMDALMRGIELRPVAPWANAVMSALIVAFGWLLLSQLSRLTTLAVVALSGAWVALGVVATVFGWLLAPAAALLLLWLSLLLSNAVRITTVVRYLWDEAKRMRLDLGETQADHTDRAEASPVLDWQGNLVERGMDSLSQAMAQLRKTERAREESLQFVSHDMRAPLSSIVALLDKHRLESDSSNMHTLLQKIEQHTWTALNLSDGFVRLARAREANLNIVTIQLDALIENCLDEMHTLAEAQHVHLAFTTPFAEPLYTQGDPMLLGRAVLNLLSNAIKYSPTDAWVECSLQQEGDYWSILVHDGGPGIPADLQSRLFKRFQTHDLNLPATRTEAIGLGLEFVRIVAARHQGSVSVQSEPGRGTTFFLRLQHSKALDPQKNQAPF